MATPREVLERTRPMMALAESVDPVTPGAAGLAYQAAELAVHVLLMEVDGFDPWGDDERYRRATEILGIDVLELSWAHEVRLRDFYAHARRIMTPAGRPGWGPPLEVPDDEDCRRAVRTARTVLDAVWRKLT